MSLIHSRVIAIGDIHGCAKTFRKLLFDVLKVEQQDGIICIGDYVDRGPDSKGVVDTILELREQNYDIITLRGNHEEIMMDSVLGPEAFGHWNVNGGEQTLTSFGVESYTDLDDQYKQFFEETVFWHTWDKYILVHAGLNFNIPDPMSDTYAMLWTRETEVDQHWLGDRVVVHGHTPRPKENILSQHGQNINIDGGCVYPHREGMGWLVALELRSGVFTLVENVDVKSEEA